MVVESRYLCLSTPAYPWHSHDFCAGAAVKLKASTILRKRTHVRPVVQVKTTKGGKGTAFYISPNELAFSKVHQSAFELVRVFNYDNENMAGSYYVLNGDINKSLKLEPTQYRAFIGS